MNRVDFHGMEKKWQQRWEKEGIFKVKENQNKRKYYVLEMYPYPSASFLHMGHVRNYTIGDAYARFKRLQGFNVLYPMGYDSFGLPAETAAKKQGIHPRKYTDDAIAKIMAYQKALGNSYDWDRVIASHEPEYYRWNQFFFLKLFEKGLAYRKKAPVNWCEKCQSVLANEEAEGGICWRCESEVVKKDMEQWFLKITAYADRLLGDLKKIEWPDKIKAMQENWIGRSEGVDIHFRLEGGGKILPTFTTRCDTIYSVTFLGIAPEHPMIEELVKGTKHEKGAKEFVKRMEKQSIEDRVNEEKEKDGFFTGRYAINPVNGEKVPIYIANFALMYGSGIVMCDAHDKRDFRFARKYGIPLKFVISRDGKPADPKNFMDAFTDDGILFGSGKFSGMENMEALPKMADWLEQKGFGKKALNYKLRDWMISRQRYWGTPIPMVHCARCGVVPVPESQLPVLLPEKVDFKAAGNPLNSSKDFVNTKCPKCQGPAKRETDTMGGFMDSSWYFLRYCSPKATEFAFDRKAVKYWMPVDQYIGGAEHAVMHLLYARFFIKALRDMGYVDFDEPFRRLFNQGIVYKDGHKMSKSFGNVVTQEEIAERYGIDTARLFLLFVASPESQLEWSDQGVQGAYRFISKICRVVEDNLQKVSLEKYKVTGINDRMLEAKLNAAVENVSMQIESFQFNLAVSGIMELVNYLDGYAKGGGVNRGLFGTSVKVLVQMLSPFAPHIAEELWERIGMKGFVSMSTWPKAGKVDSGAMAIGGMLGNLGEDINHVLKLAGIKPSRICLFVAPRWKYELFSLVRKEMEGTRDAGRILKSVMDHEKLRPFGNEISRMVASLVSNPEKMPEVILSPEEEHDILIEMKGRLEKDYGCPVAVEFAEKSSSKKALQALPGKPGIEVL